MSGSLTQRAHGAAPERQPQGETLADQIRKMEAQFTLAMPKGVEASQLVRDALTALRQNPKLAECDPKSVLGGLMTIAQLGLRVGVLGQAWLVPFWDSRSRTFKAQLVIGYQGLTDLAYRSDKIAGISARTVYTNDPTFTVELGTEDRILHTPATTGRRGDPLAYYAVCHLKGGRPIFYVMSHEDMEAYRDQHAMARKRDGTIVGPWVDHFESMALKTCIRQLSKWMPKSTEFATALAADEGVRVDVMPTTPALESTHHYDGDTVDGEVVDQPDEPPAVEDGGQS